MPGRRGRGKRSVFRDVSRRKSSRCTRYSTASQQLAWERTSELAICRVRFIASYIPRGDSVLSWTLLDFPSRDVRPIRGVHNRERDPDHRPGLSPFPCVAVSTRFDVHKHSTISNEISEIRLGQLSTILNRDLPECMRTRPRYRLRPRSLPVSKRSKRKLGWEDLRGILISGHVVGIGVERGVR